MAGDGALGAVDSVGSSEFGPPVNAVGDEGGQAAPLADEFQSEIDLARGDGTSVAPSVMAAATEQVGYGARPGGVPVTELHRLSPEDARARIDAHLDAYDPARNPAALREALDLAVA